jgi:hypothetical protein
VRINEVTAGPANPSGGPFLRLLQGWGVSEHSHFSVIISAAHLGRPLTEMAACCYILQHPSADPKEIL